MPLHFKRVVLPLLLFSSFAAAGPKDGNRLTYLNEP